VPYTVRFLKTAAREFASLPKNRQTQLAGRIDGLKQDLFPPGVRKLEGEDRLYRLRVGDYRILFEVDDNAKVVTITKVALRRDAYRNM
jgi:mRNA interferase RelE/StbE